ncbi:MAG: helix-turn-helix domain-containing protein [Magnetococcales bacterium]|nr:helix-turn-helix domain-containing protein [Magnetococcales bacterium]
MNLRDLRETVLRLPRDQVAERAHMTEARLTAIEEEGEPMDIAELEWLAMVYGIDADVLAEDTLTLSKEWGPAVLARDGGYHAFSTSEKLAILRVSRAVGDLTELKRLVGGDTRNPDLPLQWKRNSQEPWQQGRDIANLLRNKLALGESPIRSLSELMTENFPWISVLYADMAGDEPSGLAFSSRQQMPAIVLNVRGKNEIPSVLRVSLAHELYHLLMDAGQGQPLAAFSRHDERREEMEQRANSFAVRFICPESVLIKLLAETKDARLCARRLMADYGLPYAAVQNYLFHTGQVSLPESIPDDVKSGAVQTAWPLEQPVCLRTFPVPEIPFERRTLIAALAVRAYQTGKIPRDRLARLLDLTPAADLEAVVSHFASQEGALCNCS